MYVPNIAWNPVPCEDVRENQRTKNMPDIEVSSGGGSGTQIFSSKVPLLE